MTDRASQIAPVPVLCGLIARGMEKSAEKELTAEDVFPHMALSPEEHKYVRQEIAGRYDPDVHSVFGRSKAKKKVSAQIRKDARRALPSLLEHERVVAPITKNLTEARKTQAGMERAQKMFLLRLQAAIRPWVMGMAQTRHAGKELAFRERNLQHRMWADNIKLRRG